MPSTKVFGGAGCGKTYYLITELSNLLRSGTSARDVSMMTMTRNAAGEFKSRAIEVMGTPNYSDLRWFGTMHSIAWKLAGLKPENMAKKNLIKNFNTSIHLGGDPSLANKMQTLDSARRSCMNPCDEAGFIATLAKTGLDSGYKDGRSGRYKHANLNDVCEYGEKFNVFLEENDVCDFTRTIEITLQRLKDGIIEIPFSNIFADEYQDFTPLQRELFMEIRKYVDDTWFCGDDLQAIYRFSGASAEYMIHDSSNREIVLPKTYRYGSEILDNSNKYIAPIKDKKPRSVSPSGAPGAVSTLHGHEWTSRVHKDAGTTAYLVRTNAEVKEITSTLDNMGIMYALLGGTQSVTEGLLASYNTIAKLDGGDPVPSEHALNLLQSMNAMVKSGDMNVSGKAKQRRVLKSKIKAEANDIEWFFQTYIDDWYTAESFAKTFLQSETWELMLVASSVKGLLQFVSQKHLAFPTPSVGMITDFVGTIHKFKGNEADNVFLFTQIPYSVTSHIRTRESIDDELRLFYVGSTRPRTNLYEVKDYFVDGRGRMEVDIDDVIERCQ